MIGDEPPHNEPGSDSIGQKGNKRKSKGKKRTKKERRRDKSSTTDNNARRRRNETTTTLSQLDVTCVVKVANRNLINAPVVEHANDPKYSRFVIVKFF